MTNDLQIDYFLYISAILFVIGIAVVIIKRNAIMVLMGIELILNAANINLVAFSRYDNELIAGTMFALFVIVVAAAEAAVALAIILKVYQEFNTANIDEVNELGG